MRIHYGETSTLGRHSGEPQADKLCVDRQGDSHRYRLRELLLVSVLISQTLSGGTHEYSSCCSPFCTVLQLIPCAHATCLTSACSHPILLSRDPMLALFRFFYRKIFFLVFLQSCILPFDRPHHEIYLTSTRGDCRTNLNWS